MVMLEGDFLSIEALYKGSTTLCRSRIDTLTRWARAVQGLLIQASAGKSGREHAREGVFLTKLCPGSHHHCSIGVKSWFSGKQAPLIPRVAHEDFRSLVLEILSFYNCSTGLGFTPIVFTAFDSRGCHSIMIGPS